MSGGGYNDGSGPVKKTTLTWSNSAAPQTFQITPPAWGLVVLTADSRGNLFDAPSLYYVAGTGAATTLSVAGPRKGLAGLPSTTFSVIPEETRSGGNGPGLWNGTVTLTPSGGGLSTPINLTFTDTYSPQSFTLPAPTFGLVTLTVTNSPSGGSSTLTNPPPFTYFSYVSGKATTFSLLGPSSGVSGSASSDFTVTLDDLPTGTLHVTITPSGGGLSTPIVLTFSGSTVTQTFQITPTSTGQVTLIPTNDGNLINPPVFIYGSQTLQVMTSSWLTSLGGPPYYLTISNTYYQLASSLSPPIQAVDTAFCMLNVNQTLDLNGNTIEFDNNTAPGVVNGGFETDAPGSTSITGWTIDLTQASGASAYIATTSAGPYEAQQTWGWWGNQILQVVNVPLNGTVTITSDAIAIPVANVEYCAMIQVLIRGGTVYSGTSTIQVIDQTTGLAIPSIYSPGGNGGYDDGAAYDPIRGTLTDILFVPTTTNNVKLKVQATPTGQWNAGTMTVMFDHADLVRSRCYGVWASGSTYAPVWPAYLMTSTVQSYTNQVSYPTIKNGELNQVSRSYKSSAITMSACNGPTVDSITSTCNGGSLNQISISGAEASTTVTNCNLVGNMDIIIDRANVFAAMRLLGNHGVVICNNNTISGVQQAGIVVGGPYYDYASPDYNNYPSAITYFKCNYNTVENWTCNWTDGYGIGVAGISNFEIAHNSVIPIVGRGLYIDAQATPVRNGIVHNNHFEGRDRNNLEYNSISLDATALRQRSGKVSGVTYMNNEFCAWCGLGTAWAAVAGQITNFTGIYNPQSYGNNHHSNVKFIGNTFQAIVESLDPNLPEVYLGNQAWAIGIDRIDDLTELTFIDNNLVTNVTGIGFGDDDSWSGVGRDVTWISNTITQNSVLGLAANSTGLRPFNSMVTGDSENTIGKHRLYDMRYAGGAPALPTGLKMLQGFAQSLEVGWLLDLTVTQGGNAVAGASVTVTDNNGNGVVQFSGVTDASGQCLGIKIITDKYSTDGTTNYNSPIHVNYNDMRIEATYGSYSGTQSINITETQTLSLAIS